MLTFLFIILLIVVLGKLVFTAFRLTWGITKIFFHIIFLPLILIGMVVGGLVHIAIPILIIFGIASFLMDSQNM